MSGVTNSTALPLVNRRNVLRLGSMGLAYCVSFAPQRWTWTAASRLIESHIRHSPEVARVAARMEQLLGDCAGSGDCHRYAQEYLRAVLELRWLRSQALRARSPGVLVTEVSGTEHVQRAMAAGRGAILWGMQFCGFLVVKMALHRAGVPLVHLSAAVHGAGNPATRAGLRWVAPLYRLPEDRHIAERVVIPLDGSLGYLRALKQRLAENHTVWIAGEPQARRRNVPAPFFGRLRSYASGAPALAWRTGAALLPVATVRVGKFHYRTIIEPPVSPGSEVKRGFVDRAVGEFSARLERRIRSDTPYWTWERTTFEYVLKHSEPMQAPQT